ncbi:hypothetical protein FGIG_09089 [Fasciola gigantica]|uniref:Uncharacterized protein n=1 Tax=Fasciola gigantica TaxID=46835 RepID=A0A504YI10_FASGI|nr:hypothetical protein FGIG_09089 [Fasciola gigantica]
MAKSYLHLRLFRMSQKVTLCLILCIAMITADRSVKVLLQDLEKFIEFWQKLSSDLIKNASEVSKIYLTLKERFMSLKTNDAQLFFLRSTMDTIVNLCNFWKYKVRNDDSYEANSLRQNLDQCEKKANNFVTIIDQFRQFMSIPQ